MATVNDDKPKLSIKLKSLTRTPYLENLDAALEIGSGIIGMTAKSSNDLTFLLKVISGIEKPDAGEIYFNNSLSVPKFPYIPPLPSSLLWLTVKENIDSVPNKSKDTSELISKVGLSGYEDHYPNSGSTGFRFRISLAMALSLNPAVILLDNILAIMDQETKSEIIELLKELSSEVTFIYSSQDIKDLILLTDKVILLKNSPINAVEKTDIKGSIEIQKFIEELNAG